MQAYVQKWDNSLALRIPGNVAKGLNLKEGSSVNIIQDNDRLVIIPILSPEHTLEELLDQISENNIHTEVDTGIPQGKEIWYQIKSLDWKAGSELRILLLLNSNKNNILS